MIAIAEPVSYSMTRLEIVPIVLLLGRQVIIGLNIHVLIIGKKYINELFLKYFPYRVKQENLKSEAFLYSR